MTYWKDTLLIGIPKIDTEHKKLIGAIDELMDACTKGQGREKIDKTLSFVVSYTKEHFSDEEKIHAEYSYPGKASHKQLHAMFLSNMSLLEKEFKQTGPSIVLVGKLNKSLVDWLISHISVEDKKFGEYVAAGRAR